MAVKRRLSPDQQLRIFVESLKGSTTIAELCRREDIWPNEYQRIKQKALSGALEALKNSRRRRKDPEKEHLKREIEKLRTIILSQAEEINLLKKRANWDY